MKIFLVLVISVLASSVFAQVDNIQVNINGRIYQCSGDGGVADQTCRNTAQAATSKYEACVAAGNYKPSCFSGAFNKKVNSCTVWSEACNNACVSAGNYKPNCFSQCYEN